MVQKELHVTMYMGKNNKNKNKNPQSNHGNVNKQIHNNNGNNNMTELEINEPEKPGNVMSETLMMPQKNTNQRLSFSLAGFKKLMLRPTIIPSAKEIQVL